MSPKPDAREQPVRGRRIAAALCLFLLTACSRSGSSGWKLTDIRGHLPDLAFHLSAAGGVPVTARQYRGKVVLLFFGFTHCPDTCPETLARLAAALRQLGPEAREFRILFVSVDPRRDTPEATERFARAFSPQAVGLTGTPDQIEAMAKRYRVAYEAQAPDRAGDYEVMHSKGVYIFDRAGRARLLDSDTDPVAALVRDLKQLAAAPS